MIVQTAWLFTRGSQSVRIVRAVTRGGVMRLAVLGPGDETDAREFTDAVACANYQAGLERRLVTQGYTLEQFTSDRRSAAPGRFRPTGRRRMPPLFL